MLKDIATLTGATVISEELGLKLDKITPDLLGQAKTVKVTKEETTIVDGKGAPEPSRAASNRSSGRSKTPTRPIARSSRSASPSCRAASR